MASTIVVLAARVPPVTVTSATGNALMGWLKVKVAVTGPVTAVVLTPPMTTVGAAGGVGAGAAGDEELPPQPSISMGTGAASRVMATNVPGIRIFLMGSPWGARLASRMG